MDRKETRLVKKALRGHSDFIEQFRIRRRWKNVANYVNDWDQVRAYIRSNVCMSESELAGFYDACVWYNENVPAENTLSTGQKAGAFAGAAVIGLALGYLTHGRK